MPAFDMHHLPTGAFGRNSTVARLGSGAVPFWTRGTAGLKLPLVGVAIVLAAVGTAAQAKTPPLRDPAFLNIGFVCQWKEKCIQAQRAAMNSALAYVRAVDPPNWKIQLCNRNASRSRDRVDWIGYDRCIRNPKLKKPSRRARR